MKQLSVYNRGAATPSPSRVLSEAGGATTSSQIRRRNLRAQTKKVKKSIHAAACELSLDKLFFASLLLASKEMMSKEPYTTHVSRKDTCITFRLDYIEMNSNNQLIALAMEAINTKRKNGSKQTLKS